MKTFFFANKLEIKQLVFTLLHGMRIVFSSHFFRQNNQFMINLIVDLLLLLHIENDNRHKKLPSDM